MVIVIILFLLLCPSSYAATGDIIGTSLINDAPSTYGTRQVVTGTSNGCYSNTGSCAKLNVVSGVSSSDFWVMDIADRREVTVVWYERYSAWPLEWWEGGCKSIRPFWGGGDQDYMFGLISYYGGNEMYTSAMDTGIVTPGSGVEIWTTPPHSDSCTDLGDGTYDCNTPNHIKFTWEGMGTNWRKMRYYIKLPSSNTASDGENKLWVDEQLIYSVNGVSRSTLGSDPRVVSFRIAPVDQSYVSHEHWYDDVIAYEGYLPPSSISNASASISARGGVGSSGTLTAVTLRMVGFTVLGRGSSSNRGNVRAIGLGAAFGTYRHANIIMQ